MGHCIQYEDYKEKVDRKKVQADWDNYVSHTETGYQEGTAGLPNKIRWLDSAPIQKIGKKLKNISIVMTVDGMINLPFVIMQLKI